MQALGLYDNQPGAAEDTAVDHALLTAVNGKFGLVAIGTAGYVG